MGARDYLASAGVFTSPDTAIGDLTSAVTLNRYTEAWGDPIRMFDPDGHWPTWSGIKNFISNAFSAGYNLVWGSRRSGSRFCLSRCRVRARRPM